MLDRLRRHASYANVTASIALFLALGGVSYAAMRLPANSVGTAQLKNRAVTLSKVAPGAQSALRGQTGPPGPPGPQGPQGVTFFARVDESGAIHQRSPGVTASESSTYPGLYYVDFPQDVSGCVPVISQADSSNGGFVDGAQFVATAEGDYTGPGLNPSRVDVNTIDPSGHPISAAFDLILAC